MLWETGKQEAGMEGPGKDQMGFLCVQVCLNVAEGDRLRGTKGHSPSTSVPAGHEEARDHDPARHRAIVRGVTAHPNAGEAMAQA